MLEIKTFESWLWDTRVQDHGRGMGVEIQGLHKRSLKAVLLSQVVRCKI